MENRNLSQITHSEVRRFAMPVLYAGAALMLVACANQTPPSSPVEPTSRPTAIGVRRYELPSIDVDSNSRGFGIVNNNDGTAEWFGDDLTPTPNK